MSSLFRTRFPGRSSAILVAHVNKAEAERTLLKPPATWQAYDFLHARFRRLVGAVTPSDLYEARRLLYEARRLLDRSISLDPNYARAYAMLSQTHLVAWILPLDEDHLSPAALERAHSLLESRFSSTPISRLLMPTSERADLRGPA